MEEKYVSEEIGDEYEEWGMSDKIYITAPTGSGKSYFIIENFSKYFALKDKKILYLVNRKILKSQIEEEIDVCFSDLHEEFGRKFNKHITVMTYQMIEQSIVNGTLRDLLCLLDRFDIVVYDECHYFYIDSTFNTYTQVSYECLRRAFYYKMEIFMSATMEKIEPVLKKWTSIFLECENRMQENILKRLIVPVGQERTYTIPKNNLNIDLKLFDNFSELKDLIIEGQQGKWLVFTDTIKNGKMLCREITKGGLENHIDKEDVAFIDASYRTDPESSEAVDKIIKEKCSGKKVIITTSVMDNGISFKDKKLNNVVILCDIEETFIQMLGRKRRTENEKITLYICRRDSSYFEARLQSINRVRDTFKKYENAIDAMYQKSNIGIWTGFKWEYYTWGGEQKLTAYLYLLIMNYNEYFLRVIAKQYNNELDKKLNQSKVLTQTEEPGKPLVPEYLYMNLNYQFLANTQQFILKDMLGNNQVYCALKKLIYMVGGIIGVNEFSEIKLNYLKRFYKEIISELENDQDAFLRHQMKWIDYPENECEAMLKKMNQDKDKTSSDQLEEIVREYVGKQLNKEERIQLRNKLQDLMCYFFKRPEDKSKLNSAKRNDSRAMAKETFDALMNRAGLPYVMDNHTILKRETTE